MSRADMRTSFDDAIRSYEAAHGPLPGISIHARRIVLVEQLVDSARRNEYFARLRTGDAGPESCDPTSSAFNPLRAAIRQDRESNRDEAFWMIFLYVHFGKHRRSRWRLAADVYGRLDSGPVWTWHDVSADVTAFRAWLADNVAEIKSREPRRGFGNHRKYESLDAWSDRGTGAVFESYVDWVGPDRSHDVRIAKLIGGSTGVAAKDFEVIYRSIQSVRRFGRTAAFDYCATLAKLGLAPIEPGMACLVGSTGPLDGARLLLCEPGRTLSSKHFEPMLSELQADLGVGFDALEDALCNWQKSPEIFKPFRG